MWIDNFREPERVRELDSNGTIEFLLGWLCRYPIVAIEDPLAEDDADKCVDQ